MKKKRTKSFNRSRKKSNKKQQKSLNQSSTTLPITKLPTPPKSTSFHGNDPLLCNSNFYKFNAKLLHSLRHVDAITFNVDLSFFFNTNFTNQGLDDKSKFLHNIFTTVANILHQYSCAKRSTNPNINRTTNALPSSDSFYFFKNSSSLPELSFKRLKCVCTQSCTDLDSCCLSNELINFISEKGCVKKSRPSYIIERDCHVFGGCQEDDANDEFFIR